MIRLKVPSLETNWLQRSEKWLPQPEVWVSDFETASGAYCYPGIDTRGTVFEAVYPTKAGAIVIVESQNEELGDFEATLAHEWRHHWQFWCGWKYDGNPGALARLPYEQAIYCYFRSSRSEMDALLFERRVAPSPGNDRFLDIINTPQT